MLKTFNNHQRASKHEATHFYNTGTLSGTLLYGSIERRISRNYAIRYSYLYRRYSFMGNGMVVEAEHHLHGDHRTTITHHHK